MGGITEGQVGPEAKYALKFEGGSLVVGVDYEGADLGAGVSLKFKAEPFIDALIDKLESAIPGDQKGIAEMLKAAISQVMK